jgi:hypothetical protein
MKECIYIRHIRLVWMGEKSNTIEIFLRYCLVYDQLGGYDVNKTVPTFSMLSIWRKKFYSFRMYYKVWANFLLLWNHETADITGHDFCSHFNP